MTKHERIISMFEIGRPSGQRCQVEGGRNRIEGGNGKGRQQQQSSSSSSREAAPEGAAGTRHCCCYKSQPAKNWLKFGGKTSSLGIEAEKVYAYRCTQKLYRAKIIVTRINMSLWRWKTTGQGMFVQIYTTRVSDIGLRVRACRTRRSRKRGWLERTRGCSRWRRASTSSRSRCGSSGRELSGRRRLSTGWGRSWEGRRTCREPEGWSRGPATPSRTPASCQLSRNSGQHHN